MKNIMLMVLIFSVSFAHASDWTQVSGSDAMKVYFDKASVVRSGKMRKAWVTYSYKEAQTSNSKPYKSVKSLGLYSCSERMSGDFQMTWYAEEIGLGLVTSTWQIPTKDIRFSEVVPDSVGEGALNAICQIKIPTA